MISAMNKTKWDELRLAMYELDERSPRWRTRDVQSGYVCPWDREWFHHFRTGGYTTIEWVEIEIESPEQRSAVFNALRRIHVPGQTTEHGFKIFGYLSVGAVVDYI
jgi:hypothetical protein